MPVPFRLPVFIASISLLAGSVLAQTTLTSPKGFASTDGAGWSLGLGAYPYARFSIQDGEHRNKAMSLKQVATRPDHKNYGGGGRRWYRVFLKMSECRINANQTSWTRMSVTTPTLVFAKPVTWPTLTGKPPSNPLSFTRRFPFSTKWQYSGRNDINFDFEFVGGILENGARWHRYYRPYPSDAGHTTYGFAGGAQASYGSAGPWGGGCRDSNRYNGAVTTISSTTYGLQYGPVTALRGGTEIFIWTRETAPNRFLSCSVGVAGGNPGTLFPGVSCNRHYVDLSRPTLFLTLRANAQGATGTLLARAPHNSAYVGLQLFAQSGWQDSKTNVFRLTSGSSTIIPAMPGAVPHRYGYFSMDWNDTKASGPSISPSLLPIMQLTQ